MRAVSLRPLVAAGLLTALVACAGTPPIPAASRGPAGAQIKALTARGLPAGDGRKLIVLAADGVDYISLFGGYYALAAAGWSVRIATPAPSGTISADGRAVPSGLTFDRVKTDGYTALYVPAGLPAGGVIDAIIAAAAGERHLVVAPGAGARVAAAGVKAPLATDEQMVRIEGNVLSAARTGDLPHLVWTLSAYADDRLRAAEAAASRTDPP